MPASQMSSLAWRWLALVIATLGCCAAQPAQAHAADGVHCPGQNPKMAHITSRLTFRDIGHYHAVEVQQATTIEMPEHQWRLENALTLGVNTPEYRNAVYCLLHRGGESWKSFSEWYPDWPSKTSRVTKYKKGRDVLVKVEYDSWNLIHGSGEFEVGPWTVSAVPKKDWTVTLHRPSALSKEFWREATVVPGGLKISYAPEEAIAKEDDSRAWSGRGPDNEVRLVPPADVSPAPSRSVIFGSLGIVSWWVCASVVIALSAWPFIKSPDPQMATARAVAFAVVQWAVVSAALGVTLLVPSSPLSSTLNQWRALVASSLALIVLAQLERPGRMKRRDVAVVCVATAVTGLALVMAPRLFSVTQNPTRNSSPPLYRIAEMAFIDVSMLWLWLAAMFAWSWRFAREGRSGVFSTSGDSGLPGSPIGKKGERPARRFLAIAVLLVGVAVAVVACRVLSFERRWRRAENSGVLFGAAHRSALYQQFIEFVSSGPKWAYAYSWVLTGIALVALLRSSSRAKAEPSLGPERRNLLLVTSVFAIVVALRGVMLAGNAANFYGLWLPLNMVSVYALVKVGGRWSVLGRVERNAKNANCVAAELSTPTGHQRLMEDARRCRDLLHRLQLVDQGHAEGATRRILENKLHALHHWRPRGCRYDCLPDPVSVVDVALSWGPCQHWWDNALKAARWASLFGILPSMVTAWYENAYGKKHWVFTLDRPTGIPDTVGKFLTQEISFAGAGLVLGALWRVLPGEHGPVRALTLFFAWLAPVGLLALYQVGKHTTELGLTLLNIVLMLMVLTLTSMWIDTDTFSHERHYWTRRLKLLASIYQVHGLSGQMAYLLAQAAAAVGIWQAVIHASK
ncbi:DUF6185 family protein [Streptomyces sp. NPDC054834]